MLIRLFPSMTRWSSESLNSYSPSPSSRSVILWRNGNVCIFCRHIISLSIQCCIESLGHFVCLLESPSFHSETVHFPSISESGEEEGGNQLRLQPYNALRLHCWNLATNSAEFDSALFHSAFCSSNLMMGIGLECLPIPSLLNSTRNKNGISSLLFLPILITFFNSGAI